MPGFLPRPTVGDHVFHHFGDLKHLVKLIFLKVVPTVLRHVHEGVETHNVGGTENRTLGAPGCGAKDRIYFFDGIAVFLHHPHGVHHAKNPNSVGDEIGGVFAPDHPLAQNVFAQIFDGVPNIFSCVWAGNQFKQV